MPKKEWKCDYCDDPVTSNTVGIDINKHVCQMTICAKCLKSCFDWIAGRRRREKKNE